MGTDRTRRAPTRRADRTTRRAGVAVALAVVLVASACSDDEPDPNEPADEAVTDIDARTAPVCLLVGPEIEPEVEDLPVIDCALDHTHEIFATLVYDEGDVYPGAEALGAYAQVECLTPFEDFVGISAFDSTLSYTWLVPSLNSWNDEGDREIWCTLADREAGMLTGSMEGTRQ